MNYLLFICTDGVPTPEKTAAMHAHIPGWIDEMDGRGVRRFGHALEPAASAVSVRVRNGETLVSDGPFAESKEFVGGFDVIQCEDLDEAIEVAAKHPVSWFHSIEVRPFADYPMGSQDETGEGQAPTTETPDGALLAAPPAGRRRYLLSFCVNGIPETDEEEDAIRRDAAEWLAAVRAQGSQRYGHALAHAETATTVRVRDGETLISDGPFVETKEFIGGFDVLDCASREEAVELAARHPLARYHVVEVRAFAEEE